MSELLPCPHCGASLFIRAGANPYGRCETAGCWMNERKATVPLHDPLQVAAWNLRTPAAPSEGLEARAREIVAKEVDDGFGFGDAGDVVRKGGGVMIYSDQAISSVVTALSTRDEIVRECVAIVAAYGRDPSNGKQAQAAILGAVPRLEALIQEPAK